MKVVSVSKGMLGREDNIYGPRGFSFGKSDLAS